MKYLIFVQNLKRLLIQTKASGIDPVLVAVPDFRLVHELRTYAFGKLSDNERAREIDRRAPGPNFTDDLLNKDAFALRVRYGVIKLKEFSIDGTRYFDYLSKAIDRHFGIERIDRAKALRQQLDRATRLFGIAERTSAIWDGSNWNVWGPGAVVEVLVDDVKTYQSAESFQ